jgi:hypothetical protein
MKRGFADCGHAIVTLAATSKNFLMVNGGNNAESLRGMTGLARVTACNVIWRPGWNRAEVIVVTVHAV